MDGFYSLFWKSKNSGYVEVSSGKSKSQKYLYKGHDACGSSGWRWGAHWRVSVYITHVIVVAGRANLPLDGSK